MPGRSHRIRARHPARVRNCLLRGEWLEPRAMMSGNGVVPAAAPTLAHPITVSGGTTVTGKTASLSVLGSDAAGAAKLAYDWSVISAPAGGAVTFNANGNNAAENTVLTFTKAGTYNVSVKIVDPSGLSVTNNIAVNVSATLTSVKITTSSNVAVSATTALQVSTVSQSLVAQGLDQFGNALVTQPTFKWSTATIASGAPTPSLSASGAGATFTYGKVGSYVESVQATQGTVSMTGKAAVLVLAKPTYITVTQVGGTAQVTGKTAQFAVSQFLDQFHNAMTDTSKVAWTATTIPGGALAPTFSTSGANTTVTFKDAGQYVLKVTETDSAGNAISQSVSVTVAQTATAIKQANVSVAVTGTNVKLTTPTVIDQFGNTLATQPAITWSATTTTSGAAAPVLTTAGGITTATFSSAGTYTLTAKVAGAANLSYVTTATVTSTITSIAVTPGAASVNQGATQQFTAQAFDQFGKLMKTQPSFAWSTSGGAITAAGLFTAPNSAVTDSITAKNGSITGTTTISVKPSINLGLQNAYLNQLMQSLDADGSISRADMIQILDAVAAKGSITASELSDLQKIDSDATTLDMAGYVQQLASDVINGNVANATYQGKTLGNLAVGSSALQMTDLVDKWFLGTDLPTLTDASYVYKTVAGSLFPTTPSIANEFQGELGDCYFISSLGTIADQDPTAIEDMIINNGDGTYTVRFYTGNYGSSYNASNGSYSDGFTNGTGTPEYVTVNSQLPTTASGMLVYSDYGASYTNASNSLWIPLLEKAYAQWNQTGAEGRDGSNTYAGIEGGWMATVDAQVLGHNATDYMMGTATEQQLITALSSGQAVTIATINDEFGLYGSHAYAVTAYNASTNTFTLYNPWGFDQPGQLTWSELTTDCSAFTATTASGATAISGAVLKSGIASAMGPESSDFAAAASTAGSTSAAAVDLAFGNGGDFLAANDGSHGFGQQTITNNGFANIAPTNASGVTSNPANAADTVSGNDNWLGAGTTHQLPGLTFEDFNLGIIAIHAGHR